MDVEDRRRYFIVGSVFLEIVQPLFRTRLEHDYSGKGIGSLQAFLRTLPVIHILFHLRHRNAYCCKDKLNCRNNSKLPLIYCQWDLLYTENPGQPGHNCHCKFTANPVQLNELDITLASLILLNCCHLGPSDENAVRELRRFKNAYLSHNTEGKINETEYKSLWKDLTYFVIQLDPNKQDDLIRIEKRPLDEGLCIRYSIDLLNIHKKLNEMGTQIQGISSGMQMMGPQIQGTSSRLQVMGPQIQGISSGMQMMVPQIQGITSVMQELLSYQRNEATCQYCKKKLIEQVGSSMQEMGTKDQDNCPCMQMIGNQAQGKGSSMQMMGNQAQGNCSSMQMMGNQAQENSSAVHVIGTQAHGNGSCMQVMGTQTQRNSSCLQMGVTRANGNISYMQVLSTQTHRIISAMQVMETQNQGIGSGMQFVIAHMQGIN